MARRGSLGPALLFDLKQADHIGVVIILYVTLQVARIASVRPLSADAHDDAVAARHLREQSNGYWTAEARTATQTATQAPPLAGHRSRRLGCCCFGSSLAFGGLDITGAAFLVRSIRRLRRAPGSVFNGHLHPLIRFSGGITSPVCGLIHQTGKAGPECAEPALLPSTKT